MRFALWTPIAARPYGRLARSAIACKTNIIGPLRPRICGSPLRFGHRGC